MKKANLAAYDDKGVISSIENVKQLTTEVQLAKDGFLSKDKVVEHYNETMGKTTGLVKTLDEVEQQLVKNGEAFIKMTLYKATATLAAASKASTISSLSFSLSPSSSISLCLSIYLSVYLSIYLSMRLSLYLSIDLSNYFYIYTYSICGSPSPSLCISLY